MNWLKSRLKERSTLDGVAMVAFCGAVILFGDLAHLFALAGVVYGLCTIFKSDK
jgi:type IV secretory pathway VirB2 component (pilin)